MINILSKYIWSILGIIISFIIGIGFDLLTESKISFSIPIWFVLPFIVLLIGLIVEFIKSKKTEQKKEKSKDGSDIQKKILPLHFMIKGKLQSEFYYWDVMIDSRVNPKDDNVNRFLDNLSLSNPYCVECESSLTQVYGGFICPNKCYEKDSRDEYNYIEENTLNQFRGEVRKDFPKWKNKYKKKYEEFTDGKNEEFELPKVIRSISI